MTNILKNAFAKSSPYFKLIILILAITMFACQSKNKSSSSTTKQPELTLPPANDDYFQEIIKSSGINFTHTIGDDHLSNLVESVGGGAAFLDYDQDGYLDLYLSNGNFTEGLSLNSEGHPPVKTSENRLFRNLGNGTFSDATKKARVGDRGYGMGITVGDFDNDGYPDIYVSNYGTNTLYHNNGNGTFSDVTKKAGVGGNECSVGAVWLDYDNDGFLDLYVGNYIEFDPKYNYYYAPDGFPGPMAYDGQPDILYHNQGDGTFEDVTKAMGLFNKDGRAMGVGAADYDNDGFIDIFVSNDHMVNYLYHNEQGKKFVDRGIMSGVAFNQVGESTISMSVDFADYNNDGLIDLFVSDDVYCSLYKNEGNGVFSEMSYNAGIAVACGQFVGWASSFLDYDNDGDLDLFKVNGELKHLYGQEDQLFDNNGAGKFIDVSIERGSYFKEELVGRGACFGDYDNDGDIDAYIVNLNGPGSLLRNNKGNRNNWISLLLIGDESNRDGIGARVTVVSGDIKQFTQKKSSSGYLSQNDPRLHFGLGNNKMVDSIEIIWPSGKTQVLENLKAGQFITIKESEIVHP
ncbi:ASPIC/UnbV domain protein [hydrothermal vent metagenome]|uniref:ASPIC/UnbV domain protein n=1 Tax=hydrothermal vent metagenome TaxID=652676 RepID=A0A3B0TVH5_9ZZZZ